MEEVVHLDLDLRPCFRFVGLAFSAIGFVLPGLFFLRLRPQDPRAPVGRARERVDVAVALLLVVVGSVGGVWGVASIFLPG